MLVGHVSDEYYAALAGVSVEFRRDGATVATQSMPSGAVVADLASGENEVCLARPGYGSKRVRVTIADDKLIHFRLLSDGLLGYAWPKWCRAGDRVEFHVVKQKQRGNIWKFHCDAKVDGQLVAEADIGAMIVKKEDA